ncbi:energy-coupling factor ABC transporter substrate-binding protein, partial [Streptomyces sp. SID5475]|nr:energy-coupling factor ABC transporter substrate-binding protein [Streptomyces sp. SID5475]
MSRNTRTNLLLLAVVAVLAALPLVLGLGDGMEEPFAGSDAQAETAVEELRPGYEPWFAPLYEPPSAEVESALFALQAAIGAGVLAYCLGLRRGRRQGEARAAAGAEGTAAPGTAAADRAEPAGTGSSAG